MTARQSSDYSTSGGYPASYCLEDNGNEGRCLTDEERGAYWEVDLGENISVYMITVDLSGDDRMNDHSIYLLDSEEIILATAETPPSTSWTTEDFFANTTVFKRNTCIRQCQEDMKQKLDEERVKWQAAQPISAELCNKASFEVCSDFARAFDKLYAAKPLDDNPMKRNQGTLVVTSPINTLSQVQFPTSYTFSGSAQGVQTFSGYAAPDLAQSDFPGTTVSTPVTTTWKYQPLNPTAFHSSCPCSGIFMGNENMSIEMVPVEIDADTYVFGTSQGGIFKMRSVNAQGEQGESRYTTAISNLANLDAGVWGQAITEFSKGNAIPFDFYKVRDLDYCSSCGRMSHDKTGTDNTIDAGFDTELQQLKLPPSLEFQWPKGHSTLWELISHEVGDYVEEVGTSMLTALGANVVTTDRHLAGTGERHFEVDVKWPNGGSHILEEVENHHSLAIEALEEKLNRKIDQKIDQVESKVDQVKSKVDELAQQIKEIKDLMGDLLSKM